MKFVIQRVTHADVSVDHNIVGSIDKGFMVLIGINNTDTTQIADKMIKKLVNLRIFEDANGKTNLSLNDVDGSLLLISQFTLYADSMSSGNRPSFIEAARPEEAIPLYEYFCEKCAQNGIEVQSGIFGADMKVELLNDGPVTIVIEK